MRLLFLVLLLTLTVQSGLAQSEAAPVGPGIGDAYLAKDDGTGKPGEPVSEFRTSDVPIHCVVVLDANGRSAVKMIFVAVDVAGVRPETKVVTSTYWTTENQNKVPAAALWMTNIVVQLFVISTYWSYDAFSLMLNLTSVMALICVAITESPTAHHGMERLARK